MHTADVLLISLSYVVMAEGAFQAFLKNQANLRKVVINLWQKQVIIWLGFTQEQE